MNASEAAQKLAELVNSIEHTGLSVTFSPSEIHVGNVCIRVGQFEGDPWAIERE